MTTTTFVRAEPFFSKRRFGRAALWAVGGCMLACGAPILTTLALGSAGTALARIFRPGTELAVGGLAFVAALGVGLWTARQRRARPGPDLPIVCDPLVFTKEERAAHVELARAVLIELPVRTEALKDGYLFHYQAKETTFLAVARFAAEEHQCCPWASYGVEIDPAPAAEPAPLRLRITGGAAGKELLGRALADFRGGGELMRQFVDAQGKLSAESLGCKPPACGC
ncbi:MAG TPA: hypothetical protein VGQ57_04240 [Polyangiaceae bacterium]|jgi:hypothetical protein|nr:hypothetical protein [Polyangiaceae bacterium]